MFCSKINQYSRFIEIMRGEVQRLNSIVEQFLSLARPLDLKFETISMDDLLQELVLFAEGDAESSKVKINLETSPNLPAIRADRNYLKQLLLNLFLKQISL